MAQQQQSKPHAGKNKSSTQKPVVPPTHIVIDPPFPSVTLPQSQTSNTQTQVPEKPLPRFLRPEWVIVYITAVYVCFTGLTLWTIRRQANTMDRQAKDAKTATDAAAFSAQNTLNEIKRQADLMEAQLKAMEESSKQVNRQIEMLERSVAATEKNAAAAKENIELYISKERARLRVELKPLSLGSAFELGTGPVYVVNFTVTSHGPTAAYIGDTGCAAIVLPLEVICSEDAGAAIILSLTSLPSIIPPGTAPIDQMRSFHYGGKGKDDPILSEIKNSRLFVGIRGFIKYRDVFDREREIRFRYVWKYHEGQEYGDWVKCGKPEENHET